MAKNNDLQEGPLENEKKLIIIPDYYFNDFATTLLQILKCNKPQYSSTGCCLKAGNG